MNCELRCWYLKEGIALSQISLKRIAEHIWEIPQEGEMRVPARVFASEALLEKIQQDATLTQLRNAAHLPGIHKYALALPDAHQGYGFPVGGVAALDAEHGVISPGAIGYDVNCLTGNALVLHKDGYYRPIGEMEAVWQESSLLCQDFHAHQNATTRPLRYLKLRPTDQVYRLVTESGDEIEATADHPFWTPEGMVELGRLHVGDRVALYPFQGVPYQPPSNDVIISDEEIRAVSRRLGKGTAGNAEVQILNQLKARGLLPLRFSSPQLPLLLKILGFVTGDGSISFGNRCRQGQISFYGKTEDLAEIRDDLTSLGYGPTQLYTRERDHRIRTTYAEYRFQHRENSFLVHSTSLAVLLVTLGTPYGNKTLQDYKLPTWIFRAPLWQKRLFLSALFGAELTSPQTLTHHGYNFYAPVLSMNKREGFVDSGREFLEDIARLLEEFGVQTKKISVRREQVNRDSSISYRLRLILSSELESLLNLWSKVGFEYNRERRVLANSAVQYLKLKQRTLEAREHVVEEAFAMQATGLSPSRIYSELEGPFVNRRFIERSLYEERATGVRIASDFPTFHEYLEENTAGLDQSGMVWDRLVRLEPLEDFDDYVYDFTVDHPDHNFIANGFVVSNCGVRVCKTNLQYDDVKGKEQQLVDMLFSQIPTGIGKGSIVGKLSSSELDEVARIGVKWALQRGYGVEEDLAHCEDEGFRPGADPSCVSDEAKARGREQLGSLGSGNHFLEVQRVAEVFDEEIARQYGLFKDQIVIMIHCGSRGYGHQICTDYLRRVEQEHRDLLATLPDRELACAPTQSAAGQDYYKAMNCAINYAWCNRQLIMHRTRECVEQIFRTSWRELGMDLLYDVAHNIGKKEVHRVNGKEREVYVHRKGATRAFPKGRPELPRAYRDVGQPVIIPGSMGTGSYVLRGTQAALDLTFGSTAHGAGRVLSRTKAKGQWRADEITRELKERGIFVRGQSKATIAEEAPGAYKDLDEVVRVSHEVGIGTRVAKMVPICNIKG